MRAKPRRGMPALGRHEPPAAAQTEHRLWPMLDRQTLRDGVHRYNAEGLAGLSDRHHPGPTPRLTPEQLTELARIVERGPDPATDGVVHWRRVDLQVVIARRFGVQTWCCSSSWAWHPRR
jgi:transposase